jgi:uncharacterized membrane protein
MHRATATKRVTSVGLGVVLLATGIVLVLGLAVKQPCASGNWGDGRQYRRLCYSDIVPLYGTERLAGGRLPYLDPCPADAGTSCDEYPVLTMYLMRLTAWMSTGYASFFYVNALVLAGFAFLTAWLLYRIAGARALYFALAPSLLIYGFVNWDLLAVVLATAGTYAYLRGRDGTSGVLLGLGAAAKLYPALFVIPFALGRWRERRPGAGATLAASTALAYVAVNLPFALAAPHEWATFFRFNAARTVDWDSLWYTACNLLHGDIACSWSPRVIDALSLVLFGVVAAAVWFARRARNPDFPRWTFGFPLLVAFLLTNKVYSPQYGLWLLPWFALALPSPWLFAAFEAADVAVFVTRFTWFGRLSGFGGAPLGAFEIATVVRAAVLVACLVAWVLRDESRVRASEPQLLRPSLSGAAP